MTEDVVEIQAGERDRLHVGTCVRTIISQIDFPEGYELAG